MISDPHGENPYKETFLVLLPFNIPLCILVLMLGSIVFAYYWKNRGKLTNKIFLVITAADLVMCVGHVILMSCVALLSGDMITISAVSIFTVLYEVFSLLGYAISVYFNTMLAVLRTIKITFPFYQVKIKILLTASALYITVLLILMAVDLWYITDEAPFLITVPWLFLWFNVNTAFIGHNFAYGLYFLVLPDSTPFSDLILSSNLLAGFDHLALSLVVLVTLLVQCIVTGHRAAVQDPDQPALTDWSHVNKTVTILSSIFIFCNSGVATLQIIYGGIPSFSDESQFNFFYVFQLMVSTTLPLCNALLTPLVLLLRSQEMRGNVARMMRQFAAVPSQ